MSSGISTEKVRLKPDTTIEADQALQPWQFFVLVALACATAVTFLIRGQGITAVLLLTLLMGAAALAGLAMLRAVMPLVTHDVDRTVMIGERTRAGLEREKTLALRTIKELDFDRAMGKMSDQDFRELTARLRARAARLMRQLEAGAGYREQIEREVAKRLEAMPLPQVPVVPPAFLPGPTPTAAAAVPASSIPEGSMPASSVEVALRCASCKTLNDSDAKFCKGCGGRL